MSVSNIYDVLLFYLSKLHDAGSKPKKNSTFILHRDHVKSVVALEKPTMCKNLKNTFIDNKHSCLRSIEMNKKSYQYIMQSNQKLDFFSFYSVPILYP
jgi:hypothetical protein